MKYSFIYILIICLVIFSCNRVPEFPDKPSIAFKSVTYTPRTNADGIDNLSVIVTFQDGDGDLGLNPNELSPPFNYKNPDSTVNPNFFNFFVDIYVQDDDGNFSLYLFPPGFESISLNGRFLRLKDGNSASPLQGEINYTKDLAFADFPNLRNARVKLSISIQDRALNKSNVAETSVFEIN